MPKVRWKQGAKLTTLALGLKSDVERESIPMYSQPGMEMELTSSMVGALQKVHGKDALEIIKTSKPASSRKGGGDA